MEISINIQDLSVNDLEDNKIRRLMYGKADEYRQAIFRKISRLKNSPRGDEYHAAAILCGSILPATEAAMTTFWQQYTDPDNEAKYKAAGIVLNTWKEYCARAEELVAALKKMEEETVVTAKADSPASLRKLFHWNRGRAGRGPA